MTAVFDLDSIPALPPVVVDPLLWDVLLVRVARLLLLLWCGPEPSDRVKVLKYCIQNSYF